MLLMTLLSPSFRVTWDSSVTRDGLGASRFPLAGEPLRLGNLLASHLGPNRVTRG